MLSKRDYKKFVDLPKRSLEENRDSFFCKKKFKTKIKLVDLHKSEKNRGSDMDWFP